ncbi:bestrophin-like domain [Achromobacter aegrifaciens]
MNYSLLLAGLAVLFFVLLLIAMRIGKRLGHGADDKSAGAAAIEASVFALLGLLVAFTFSGAAQRMAERRNLLVQEVNSIGTAWLRIDMLNAQDQPKLREQFRRYVDTRIDYYRHVPDLDQRDAIAARAGALQKEIWTASMSAARNTVPPFATSYIGAVNEMFDVSSAQTVAQKVHPPIATYAFLVFLALVCACLIGSKLAATQRDSLLHQLVYAVVMTAAIYIIVDFEFPRIGTIRIDQSDALLAAQRQAMVDPPVATQ